MAFEKAPAFQFYASDFRADAKVSAMTFEEVGVYILLLTFCWTEGAIPSDPKALARLLKTDVRTIERVWPALAPCFTNQGENYIQERMERERAKLAAYRQRATTKGAKGATARWQKHGAGNATEMPVPSDTDATGIAQAKPSDGSSSSSSSSENPQPPSGAVSRSSVWAGMLPRDHLSHAACSPNFAWCVPEAVHVKLAARLAPKYGGDVAAAKVSLLDWYVAVWATLPEGTVIGDAFKFWGPRFDAVFASSVVVLQPVKPYNCNHVPPCVDDVEHTSRKMREKREVGA